MTNSFKMPCSGCKASKDADRTRAAMCQACPLAVRNFDSVNVRGFRWLWMRWVATPTVSVHCSIGGRVPGSTIGKGCPLGRHPDSGGVVKWLGVKWYGVPMPIRVWLWLFDWRHPKPMSFAGCGCIKAVKDRWVAWRGKRVLEQ